MPGNKRSTRFAPPTSRDSYGAVVPTVLTVAAETEPRPRGSGCSSNRFGPSTTAPLLSRLCLRSVAAPAPGPRPPAPHFRSRGSALLMVLWVSAALAAISFSLASTVRGETERTATAVDSLRSYYLAVGGVQRGMVELLWGILHPDQRMIPKGATVVNYSFPSGEVRLELLPEAGKLDVNNAPVADLYRLLIALGQPEGAARDIASAIDDWRRSSGEGGFDGFYTAQTPSFRAPHASFQEIEELLLVKGVTPELFYGTYVPGETLENANPNGPRLVPRPGLMDCLSVYGGRGQVDVNTASPATLAAIGLNSDAINAVIARRTLNPLTTGDLGEFMSQIGAPGQRLRVEGHSIITLRATARLRQPDGKLSDLKRTVAAMCKYLQPNAKSSVNVLRWYDTAWSY
jgi:general secretion pathway protein K